MHQGPSNDDDDGRENITKKMNLRPFKLYHVYLETLNYSILGDFSWSWILKGFVYVQIEKGKFVVVFPRPPQNAALVWRRSRAVDVKEIY